MDAFFAKKQTDSCFNTRTDTYETVHFDSHDISKPYSSSVLTELDEDDVEACDIIEPVKERLDRIVKVIRGELGLYLMGIDVIIENVTGRYAIIDMNSFPGSYRPHMLVSFHKPDWGLTCSHLHYFQVTTALTIFLSFTLTL